MRLQGRWWHGLRLIIADGLGCGTIPCPELADLGIGQSCRAYAPFGISHYQAPWATWLDWADVPPPAWPGGWENRAVWTRENVEAFYQPWRNLIAQGVGVHLQRGRRLQRDAPRGLPGVVPGCARHSA